jgi:hypothetical protein
MIVRWGMSSRIGKVFKHDKDGQQYRVVRQVHWAKAIESNKEWQDASEKWRYFYYEVEPVEENNQTSI